MPCPYATVKNSLCVPIAQKHSTLHTPGKTMMSVYVCCVESNVHSIPSYSQVQMVPCRFSVESSGEEEGESLHYRTSSMMCKVAANQLPSQLHAELFVGRRRAKILIQAFVMEMSNRKLSTCRIFYTSPCLQL